jgi:hypothetical protein
MGGRVYEPPLSSGRDHHELGVRLGQRVGRLAWGLPVMKVSARSYISSSGSGVSFCQ